MSTIVWNTCERNKSFIRPIVMAVENVEAEVTEEEVARERKEAEDFLRELEVKLKAKQEMREKNLNASSKILDIF